MFSGKVKPDYRVPGLAYRRENGALKGRLYTTLPKRFKTAGWQAYLSAFYVFAGLWAALWLLGIPGALWKAVQFGLLLGLVSYPVFVVYDPGLRIRITGSELKIGRRRYALNDVSSFYKIDDRDEDKRIVGHHVGFRYGEKEIEIPVINSRKVIEGIVPFLNREREAIQSECRIAKQAPASPASVAKARVVEF